MQPASLTPRHRIALYIVLSVVFVVGFASLPTYLNIGDPLTWKEEARSLILKGTLSIEPEIAREHGNPGQYFVLNKNTGQIHSKYGVMNGLITALPLLAEKMLTGTLPPWGSEHRNFFLGLLYLVIGLVSAALLYRITAYYSASPLSCGLFVIACLYCTFLWHHLRSGGQESTQLMFFLGMYWGFVRFARGVEESSSLLLSFLCLAGLALTKISFLYLVPVLTATCLARELQNGAAKGRLGMSRVPLIVFLAALVTALTLLMSWWKFGSPFLTGYEQWSVQDIQFTGSYLSFLWEALFTEQWGLFCLFPPLLLSLPFGGTFFRRHRFEAFFLCTCLLGLVLLIGKLPIWKGEWSYGPRYFVFLLPLVALPMLHFFDWLFSAPASLKGKSPAAAAALALLALSFFLQIQVERGEPFLYYWVRPFQECFKDQSTRDYFLQTHFGRINQRLLPYRRSVDALWFMKTYKQDCGPEAYTRYRRDLVRFLNRSNFYWVYRTESFP